MFVTEATYEDLSDDLEDLVLAVDRSFFEKARWFQHKTRKLTRVDVKDSVNLSRGEGSHGPAALLVVLDLELWDPEKACVLREVYCVPLVLRLTGDIVSVDPDLTDTLLCISGPGYEAVLEDGVASLELARGLFRFMAENFTLAGREGVFCFRGRLPLRASKVRRFSDTYTNSVAVIDNTLVLKTYRRLVPGSSPELEVLTLLEDTTVFREAPVAAGYVTYKDNAGSELVLIVIQSFVENQGDGWEFTQAHLRDFYEFASANLARAGPTSADLRFSVREFTRGFMRDVATLGMTVAELHLALGTIPVDTFRPEDITSGDVDEWCSRILSHLCELTGRIRASRIGAGPVGPLVGKVKEEVLRFLERKGLLAEKIRTFQSKSSQLARESGRKIRIHGDLHLGQVLKTRSGFVVIDFEGEPLAEAKERIKKYSPLKDIAGMHRSFDYAARAGLQDRELLVSWAREWQALACFTFLDSYLRRMEEAGWPYLPQDPTIMRKMLALFKLEKAIYEAEYELDNRPEWLWIPLWGIVDIESDFDD